LVYQLSVPLLIICSRVLNSSSVSFEKSICCFIGSPSCPVCSNFCVSFLPHSLLYRLFRNHAFACQCSFLCLIILFTVFSFLFFFFTSLFLVSFFYEPFICLPMFFSLSHYHIYCFNFRHCCCFSYSVIKFTFYLRMFNFIKFLFR